MERLDFPSCCIPVELFNRGLWAINRQIGDELPVNARAACRFVALARVQHREIERRRAFLFADWREDLDPQIAQFEFGTIAVFAAKRHPVQPFHLSLRHFSGNSVPAIARQAVNAGAHEKMPTQFLRFTEELIDVITRGHQYGRGARECPATLWTGAYSPASDSFPFPQSAPASG